MFTVGSLITQRIGTVIASNAWAEFATPFAPVFDEFWYVKNSIKIFEYSFGDTVRLLRGGYRATPPIRISWSNPPYSKFTQSTMSRNYRPYQGIFLAFVQTIKSPATLKRILKVFLIGPCSIIEEVVAVLHFLNSTTNSITVIGGVSIQMLLPSAKQVDLVLSKEPEVDDLMVSYLFCDLGGFILDSDTFDSGTTYVCKNEKI